MIKTRNDVKQYARSICIPMLEHAAERRLSRRPCEVVDTISYVASELEELFRPFWGITPILRDGEDITLTIRGETVGIGDWLREVLVTGTNPNSPFSWDKYKESTGVHSFHFQNITELAGLYVGMFFAKEATWDKLSATEQRQVADWTYDACIPLCEQIAQNNHVWFPMLCLLVLKKFGYSYERTDRYLREGIEKLDTMYVDGGWYSDGVFGRIDYYEAWSLHAYPLLWCLIEDDSFDGYEAQRNVYIMRTTRFLQDFVHFFDSNGAFPPFGRSLAYRFAAVCVFPLAILAGADFDAVLAGSVTMRCIDYFHRNVLTDRTNILPPGYLYNAPALVENYTSSGGAYWATKAFLCLLMDASHPFWSNSEKPLPVEQGAYLLRPKDERLNFRIAGDATSGVTVYNNHFSYYQFGRYCNPFNDMASYYNKFVYNSRAGFGISSHDIIGSDNMITLITPDESMKSHRYGFTDLGTTANGCMVSEHIPFANDRTTRIVTYLLPLGGSMHLRVHRVILSQTYKLCEGGYSLGIWDDYRITVKTNGGFTVKNRVLESILYTAASTEIQFRESKHQPGMHMLAPFSVYPTYASDLLDAGIYLFASVVAVRNIGTADNIPTVSLDGSTVFLTYPDGSVRQYNFFE